MGWLPKERRSAAPVSNIKVDRMKDYLHERTQGEAEQIIAHAHEHVDQFRNRRMEQAVALRVMEMYFQRTGQTGEKTSK